MINDRHTIYSNVSYLLFLECRNRASDEKCDQWAALGRCVGNKYESMYIQCKRSCGFCSKYYVIDNIQNWVSLLEKVSALYGFNIFVFIFQSPTICMKRYQRPLACLS